MTNHNTQTLQEQFEEILGIQYLAPHSSPDGTTWEHPRCADCWCTIQEVHTHGRGEEVLKLLDAVADLETSIRLDEREKVLKVDHSIDVRYEPDLELAFNKFIKKWCGSHYPHLVDSDEQDGEFIRQKIRELLRSLHPKKEEK